MDLVDQAPTDFTVPDIGPYTWTYWRFGTWRLVFDDSQPWLRDPQSGVVLYLTIPQAPTITFNRRSFQQTSIIRGVPPPFVIRSPVRTPSAPWKWFAGRVVWARYFFMQSDGRTHAARVERNLLTV